MRLIAFKILIFITCLTLKMDAQQWHPFSGHTDNYIFYSFLDSTSGFSYFCGRFDSIYGVPAKNIAYYDGINWNSMGAGFNKDVMQVINYHGDIYAAGKFDSSGATFLTNSFAKWDGSDWIEIDTLKNLRGTFQAGPGDPAFIQDMCIYDDKLYFCGQLAWLDTFPVAREYAGLAYFDGESIKPALIENLPWRSIYSNIVVFKNEIYLTYDVFNKDTCSGILGQNAFVFVKYDSVCRTIHMIGNWNPGEHGNAIYTTDTLLYIGTNVSNSYGNYFTAFNGTSFTTLGNGFNWQVGQILDYNGQLVVTGDFTADFNNITQFYRIALWNGTTWQAFPSNCNLQNYQHLSKFGTYLIASSSTDSCSGNYVGHTTIYPTTFTSLDYFEHSHTINVFPNPIESGYDINFQLNSKSTETFIFTCFDVLGNQIFSDKIYLINGSGKINTTNLSKGLYYGELKHEYKKMVIKILVK